MEDAEHHAAITYITDAVMIMTENTQCISGGRRMSKRWAEIINPHPITQKTGDEIAVDVIKKANLRLKGAES